MTTTTRGAVRFQEGIDLAGTRIVNLATPLIAGDAATKAYVDSGGTSVVNVSPIGGGTDDWEYLFDPTDGVAVNTAAAGRPLVLTAGTYRCDSVQVLPSGLMLVCEPGVRIRQALTPNAGVNPMVAAFAAKEGAVLDQTDLAANAAAGAITISVDDSIPAGSIVRLNRAAAGASFHAATRVVRSVAGSGPYTLTLDEPLYEPFLTGDDVSILASVPTRIRIYGNGMRISGTGERYVELSSAYRCYVEGIIADTQDGALGGQGNMFAFDIGSRESTFARIHVDGGNGAIVGIALESCNRCHVLECYVERVTQKGIGVSDSCGCTVQRCSTWKSGAEGITLDGEVGNTVGSVDCVVRDCRAWNQSSYGIWICSGSSRNVVAGCQANSNGVAGLCIAGDATTCSTNRVIGGDFSDNASYGIQNGAGGDSTRITDVIATGNGVSALLSDDDVWVNGFICPSHGGSNPVVDINAGRAYLRGLDVAYLSSGGNLVVGRTGTYVELSASRLTGVAGTNGVRYFTAGVVRDTIVSGCALGLLADGTILIGDGVDASGSTTPIYDGAGTGTLQAEFAGVAPIAMTTADKTATWAEYHARLLVISGTLGAGRNLVLPKITVPWTVKNGADQTVTVKGSTGTGVAITAGTTQRVLFDGTNFTAA
jgi:hypothetical protein